MKHSWTNQKIERLRKMVEIDGLAPSQVILEPEFLDFTRNSIIGICYREKIKLPNRRARKTVTHMQQPKLITPMIFPAKQIVVKEPEFSLLSAKAGQCRWLLGKSGEDGSALICGGRTVNLSSWCGLHLPLVTSQKIREKIDEKHT